MSRSSSPRSAGKDEEALFAAALNLPSGDRLQYVRAKCGDDRVMCERLELLLAAHEQPHQLLSRGDESECATIRVDSSQFVPDEGVGRTMGRYKLVEKLGEGGCGVVYVAEQTEPVRRRVALKVIKLGMDSKQVVARFEAERQALALMDHPNIAKVLDAGAADTGRPYFVMELVNGVRITDYCDEKQLTTQERLALFIPVCHAIQHAHQKGIVHRDIKPSNVMVTLHDGVPVPKVIDFGIAKATQVELTEKTIFTQFGQLVGTPAYMSPEQAGLGRLDVDTRSDVYSLGVLLYELLTGRTPFDHRKLMEEGYEAILKAIREVEPPKPSTRLSSLTAAELNEIAGRRSEQPTLLSKLLRGELDWIVLKALEKDRNHRYETANGLAADVKRYLANEPVTAVDASATYRLRKWAGRNRLVVGAGSMVAASLLIGLASSIWSLLGERVARNEAEAATQKERQALREARTAQAAVGVERDHVARLLSVSQAERGVQLLEQGDPIGLLHLLEARKTVEHLPEERIRRTVLWGGWMKSLPQRPLTILDMPDQSGDWAQLIQHKLTHSLGRPWIATGLTNGDVVLWHPNTGQPITRFSTGKQRVGSPELSENGHLLVVNAGGSFQLWNLAPVLANQPPVRLAGKVFRYAFDATHLRVVTYANEGMPMPGEPNTDLPVPISRVQVWDSSATPALVSTWEGDRSDLSNHHFALSADGSKVLTGWESLKVWDAKSGREIEPALRAAATDNRRRLSDQLILSPSGRWLWEVIAGACQRYELSTGKAVGDPIENGHRWTEPWVSPAGQYLVLSLGGGFQVIDLDTGESLGPLVARDDDAIRAIALSPNGEKLATAGPDRAVRVWETGSGQQFGTTIMPPAKISSAFFSADGQWLTMADGDGRLRKQSLTPLPSTWIKDWTGDRALGFNTHGELLVYSFARQTMEWRDPASGVISRSWPTVGGRLMGFALSPTQRLLAAAFQRGASNESVIRFWDTLTGELQEPAINWTNVGPLAFSPDGQTLAGLEGADGSGSIQLWDVASRQPKAFLASGPKQVSWLALRFSPDGRYLAARNSYAISVWDIAAGRAAPGRETDFYVAISDDWKWALHDDLLDFSDPRQPRPAANPITSRRTPTNRSGLAISPDGRLRAADAGNKAVRLWDNLTELPVGQEMRLANPAFQRTFSPDGRLLVMVERALEPTRSGRDMRLRLWETSTGLACGPAVPLTDLPVELLFDREVRFLTHTGPFETSGAKVISLPESEILLAEMERQSWLLSGCRLDEARNVEVLTPKEIHQLEIAAHEDNSLARPRTPTAAQQTENLPPVAKPAPAWLQPDIHRFIEAKEQQSKDLATKLNLALSSEFKSYFQAALAGNWPQASNAYANFNRRIEAGPFDENSGKLFVIRQPILETHIVLEYFTLGQPRYATAFGRDIVASIPAGSIYFGGTDPGRGLVTAFAHARAETNSIFVLTQNALADSTYLDYLRQTYGERLRLPSPEDSQKAFQDYLSDAQRRLEHDQQFPAEGKQVRPGEVIQIADGRVQVSGQSAVMSINALLTKRVFDLNPDSEFYIEESSPLEWMYPHLEPHGLIMKLNRHPLARLPIEVVARDHKIWSDRVKSVVGDWLNEDTPVAEVCDFIERVFVRKDLTGFKGDPAFIGNPHSCQAYSKLRSSIAGLYLWRANHASEESERERMKRASDLASRQALALCPYSPEAVFRYCHQLAANGRVNDALEVARVAVHFPKTKDSATSLVQTLESRR